MKINKSRMKGKWRLNLFQPVNLLDRSQKETVVASCWKQHGCRCDDRSDPTIDFWFNNHLVLTSFCSTAEEVVLPWLEHHSRGSPRGSPSSRASPTSWMTMSLLQPLQILCMSPSQTMAARSSGETTRSSRTSRILSTTRR